jgi:hypothetical protein
VPYCTWVRRCEGAYWVAPYHIGGQYVRHDHRWDRSQQRDDRRDRRDDRRQR